MTLPQWNTCTRCGKRSYATRKDARRAARIWFPGDHLDDYKCGPVWHIGHLPEKILTGHATRADFYQRGA